MGFRLHFGHLGCGHTGASPTGSGEIGSDHNCGTSVSFLANINNLTLALTKYVIVGQFSDDILQHYHITFRTKRKNSSDLKNPTSCMGSVDR